MLGSKQQAADTGMTASADAAAAEADAADAALRAELAHMKPARIRYRAREAGVSEADLEEAEDSADPAAACPRMHGGAYDRSLSVSHRKSGFYADFVWTTRRRSKERPLLASWFGLWGVDRAVSELLVKAQRNEAEKLGGLKRAMQVRAMHEGQSKRAD
jgi:hypothetical protein